MILAYISTVMYDDAVKDFRVSMIVILLVSSLSCNQTRKAQRSDLACANFASFFFLFLEKHMDKSQDQMLENRWYLSKIDDLEF